MLVIYALLLMVVKIAEGSSGAVDTASFKGQYCTDPRTMRKHAAYSEWADAYSCTRHRCQPGGRNLAIYTVGCKRVEAPESAIECEEVVEDTNMQFPYCCTRLRCLVVVRGEVWTRVLGQPWETLPAAPWSHMYKMKKPPPGESFLPKLGEGPVYELQNEKDTGDGDSGQDKKSRKCEGPDCDGPIAPPAAKAHPDIVIALSTDNDKNPYKPDLPRLKVVKKSPQGNSLFNHEEPPMAARIQPDEPEESMVDKEKVEKVSEEKYYSSYDGGQRPPKILHQQAAWTEIPQNQWNEPGAATDDESPMAPAKIEVRHDSGEPLKKEEKPTHLQALVDAIGTRMKDIEGVVQRMSDKVQQGKPGETDTNSAEKSELGERRSVAIRQKKPSPYGDQYQRFINRKGSKYLHPIEGTSEGPLFGADESNPNGYFSDVSNAMLHRKQTKELPPPMYMAPVENPRKQKIQNSGEAGKKRKKHLHKRKHSKGHHKKHHGKDDKMKRTNKPSVNSVETDIRTVTNSAEDNQFAIRDEAANIP